MATTYGIDSETILFTCIYAIVDAMLNFDGDFDVDAGAAQTLRVNKT